MMRSLRHSFHSDIRWVGRLARSAIRRPAFAATAGIITIMSVVLASCGGATGSPTSATTAIVYRWGVVGNKGAIAQLELATPHAIAGIRGRVTEIATSNSDGYALTTAGAVFAWGVNSYGELGDGTLTSYETRAEEVKFPAGVKITSLPNPMPFDAGLAIDATGHVWGWGLNGLGDLCISGLVNSRPQKLPFSGVTLATGARTHALFDAHGDVYACGSGDAGEFGKRFDLLG